MGPVPLTPAWSVPEAENLGFSVDLSARVEQNSHIFFSKIVETLDNFLTNFQIYLESLILAGIALEMGQFSGV